MSANAAPLPNSPGPFPVEIPDPGSSTLWDRISTWASEHKGVVYTVAGLTLVVGAGGAIYYLNTPKDASAPGTPTASKRKAKRDRKKAKERAEKESTGKDDKASMQGTRSWKSCADEATAETKQATVTTAAEDELPEVDENNVASLSAEVWALV